MRQRSAALGVALAAVLASRAAHAQGTGASTTSAEISAIEQQIRHLQSELARVREDLAARDAQVQAARREAQQARQEAAQAPSARASMAPLHVGRPNGAQPPLAPAGAAGGPSVDVAQGASNGIASNKAGSIGNQQSAPTGSVDAGTFQLGGVRVTLGGFIELAGIYRSRNEVADISSNWNTGIPLPNNPRYHEGEFRQTARQSRLALLVQGKPNPATTLAGYFETDFQGAAGTANSNESNSYNLRLRQAYATYDNTAMGLHVLGGQSWSLLTMFKKGLVPRQENVPLTIDAQYVPGFTWTRQPQFRVDKSLDGNRVWLAASLESPQTLYAPTGPNGLVPASVGTVNDVNLGGSGFNGATSYSTDIAPDVIVKAAWDPGWGHYEVYGVGRVFRDRVSVVGSGVDHTMFGGGGGADALLPIIPKVLELQAGFLAGAGIGRYGSAQLPDAIVGGNGAPVPIPEVEALIGLIGHPTHAIDLYAYAGTEQEQRKYFNYAGRGYGYGSPLYSNETCGIELGATSGCVGNTSGVTQGTLGAWWRFIKGPWGTMEAGAQYSYTHRSIFSGVGPTPSTDVSVGLLSFRYLPFQ